MTMQHMNAKTDIDVPDGTSVLAGELPEVRVLRLEPGDVIAICTARQWTDEQIDQVTKNCARLWPHNKVAVFEVVESIFVLRQGGET